MKKENFASLLMGIVGGILFALGMCMCLVSEWNTFQQGMIVGTIGIVVGLTGIVLLLCLIPLCKGLK